jgi:hypothetical protein
MTTKSNLSFDGTAIDDSDKASDVVRSVALSVNAVVLAFAAVTVFYI